jgi:hypothetical protein
VDQTVLILFHISFLTMLGPSSHVAHPQSADGGVAPRRRIAVMLDRAWQSPRRCPPVWGLGGGLTVPSNRPECYEILHRVWDLRGKIRVTLGTVGRLLWARQWTLWFHKRRIALPVERLLRSGWGLCFSRLSAVCFRTLNIYCYTCKCRSVLLLCVIFAILLTSNIHMLIRLVPHVDNLIITSLVSPLHLYLYFSCAYKQLVQQWIRNGTMLLEICVKLRHELSSWCNKMLFVLVTPSSALCRCCCLL